MITVNITPRPRHEHETLADGEILGHRLDWASALKRVFGTEILLCPCGGRGKMIAFLDKKRVVKAILDHLGLPSVPLPIGRPRGPPELLLDN